MLFKVICFSLLNNANAGVSVGIECNKRWRKTKHVGARDNATTILIHCNRHIVGKKKIPERYQG